MKKINEVRSALLLLASGLVIFGMISAVALPDIWNVRPAAAQTPFQPGTVLQAAQLNAAFATAAITGGTINGAAIGGINPSTGRFSSLTMTTPLGPAYGGTGVANNAASTLTLTGAYPTQFTLSGATTLTLPTNGTVTALGNTSTGSGAVVLAAGASLTNTTLGSATATTLSVTGAATVGRLLTAAPKTVTATTYLIQNTDTSVITSNASPTTLTFPTAASSTGRILIVRAITAAAVTATPVSIVPLAGGSATATVLAATAGKWAFLQSDGTNWQVMMGN